MKRQYISPEIHVHGLVIESVLAAGTVVTPPDDPNPKITINREAGWGKWKEVATPGYCEESQNFFNDGQKTIDVWYGDVSTY